MSRKDDIIVSQNVSWTLQKGSWTVHVIVTLFIATSVIQIFGVNVGAQIFLILYNIGTFFFFHWIVGDPFSSDYKECTFWEQMTEQLDESSSIVFLATYPLLLYILVNSVVVWNNVLLCIYVVTLCMVVVPKLGFMHLKRFWGIRSKN